MPDEVMGDEVPETTGFGEGQRPQGTVPVDTGRGSTVQVPVGADFVPTLERLSDEYNYGGYYRIFMATGTNPMEEIVNPEDAPTKIEPGMRLAITSYDKVG